MTQGLDSKRMKLSARFEVARAEYFAAPNNTELYAKFCEVVREVEEFTNEHGPLYSTYSD